MGFEQPQSEADIRAEITRLKNMAQASRQSNDLVEAEELLEQAAKLEVGLKSQNDTDTEHLQ